MTRLRLLILEDQEDDALLVVRELERFGYDVTWERVATSDGMAAALGRNQWDLIISDFRMPTFSAPEALARYHERGFDIPFIIVSGTVSEEQAVESLKAGAHDFIPKGKVHRLGPAVSRALREAEERRARWEAERALRESEARYRRVVESVQEVIVAGTFDSGDPLRHRVTFVSPQVEAIVGCTAQEFLDDPALWSTLLHPEDVPGVRTATDDAITRRRPVDRRYRIWNRPRNEYRWIEDTFAPEVGGDNRVVGFFGTARDMTERHRIEAQLHQAQKMEVVGQLAGGIAHDFNNLLGVILGYSELGLRALEPEHPAYVRVREIQNVVERAAALPRQLLAFSRKQLLQLNTVDLNAVVADVERMLRRIIGEKIQLVTVLRDGLELVRADAGQLAQVLMNLAINARDAMPRGGRLIIETVPADGSEAIPLPRGRHVMLLVGDTGTGMDAETMSHIFEPFFTTKEPGKGTGLGLTTVQSIVTLHGGEVRVESAEGRGTTFRVYLPVAQGAEKAPGQTHMADVVPGGNETILLLEDEASLRVVVRELLETAGYAVVEAEAPESALAAVERQSPIHLLVTDLVLPRMTGNEVADAIRKVQPELKVLYVSGYAGDAIGSSVLDEQVNFLQKPFSSETLLSRIREVLDSPAPTAPRA